MASLMPVAKQKYFGTSGQPLAGGKVYFYMAGTTTFKNTWKNESKSQLNTNPVVLDNQGEAFVFTEGEYEIKVHDSNDNLIWEIDHVSSLINSKELASTLPNAGSSLIGHAPPFSTMEPRLMSDVVNGMSITPFHFMKDDQILEDYSGILQKAIEFIFGSLARPRVLDLAGRNWPVSKAITYPAKPIVGSTIQNGRISATAGFTGEAIFDFRQAAEGPSSSGTSFKVFNVIFNGGGPSPGQNYAPSAILLLNTHGVKIMNCDFQFFGSHIIYDQTTRAACEVTVESCKLNGRDRLGDGIRLLGTDNEIRGNLVSGCDVGIYIGGSTGIFNNHPYACNTAIWDKSGYSIITGNYIDNCPLRTSVNQQNAKIISNNKFLCVNTDDYIEQGAIVAHPDAANRILRNIQITGNSFYSPAGVIKMTAVNTAGGTLGGNSSGFYMVNNVAQGIGEQSSQPKHHAPISASASASVDFTGRTPFGLRPYRGNAYLAKNLVGSSVPAVTSYLPTTNAIDVILSEPGTGQIVVEADTNNPFL
ncbi:MAG TPA: hypothetical protein DD666_00870 [Advenella kashmirensis]|uniref:Uncharacterized protein n=1 Tax=Advenella kashmirensis TaxID=310575 RepID=A0A356LAH5_9BURK|nr:hypothetical protein [Advenella kashmirensis]